MSYTYAGQYGGEQVINSAGEPVVSTLVTVYEHGTNTLATLYTDTSKATTTANPVSTDASGNLTFFADPGQYDLLPSGYANRVEVLVPLNPPELANYVSATILRPSGGNDNATWRAAAANGGLIVATPGTYNLVPDGTIPVSGYTQGAAVALPSDTTVWLQPGAILTLPTIPAGTTSGSYAVGFTNSDHVNGNTGITITGPGAINLPPPLYNATGMAAWDSTAVFYGASDTYYDVASNPNGGVLFYPTSGTLNTATVLTAGHADNNVITERCLFTNVTGSISFFQATNCKFLGTIDGANDDAILIGSAGSGHLIDTARINATAAGGAGIGASTGAVYFDNDGAVGDIEAMHSMTVRVASITGPGGMNSGQRACVAINGSMRDIDIEVPDANGGQIGFSAIGGTNRRSIRVNMGCNNNEQQGFYYKTSTTGQTHTNITLEGCARDNGLSATNPNGMDIYAYPSSTIQGTVTVHCYNGSGTTQTTSLNICQDTGATLDLAFIGGRLGNATPVNQYGGGTGGSTFHNVAGYNPVGLVTVAVPASGTAVAAAPYDRTFYVTASTSTVTMAIENGPSPVIPASGFGTIRVPAGMTVTPTYTAAPTWVVEGE